ncbi:MAG: sugar ABC transporter permease [Lactobacillus delbrueckii]|jgi:fructooligosaccharide transport system permease protein|uniref:Sugar ABC transporter permease protein n=1 Tax=Lactobacillus delbrueckii TaxID=1584 RepID=A0ABD0AEI0_9LACO|nr:sugar ABC transporter permease [Lactobacillus delbrueckii]MCI1929321.1 sugar ABC transporter permease [Lactobacillus delbrueckii]MCI1949256.1 sugar ABC transporter permease [Lactobacillus delbrueckii]GHN18022.1 ABC transporter permease [Lactobacillus delbrueckii]GHN33498.1 sugar ABC transporter permease protein [Lactobacillus delbrueckii]GHN41944.1 sugar ABC transporter permease protein [Lactobacillus delbrueckii]
MNQKGWRKQVGWLYILPALILLLAFLIIPFAMSISYSFTDYNLLLPAARKFVGFQNYVQTLKDPVFLKSLRNVLQFTVFIIPIQLGIALGLALIVNKKRPGNMFFKISFFAPVVVSLTVTSVLWLYIVNPNQGLLNSLLGLLHIKPQPFLTSSKQAMFVIIGISAWQGAGYQMLIFLSGLQAIPHSLYEAAELDGANAWQRFTNITMPSLRPTTIMILTTTLISALNLMTQSMVMTQGGPDNATMTPIYYIYRTGFTDRQLGFASAMSVIYGIIIIIFTLIQRKLTNKGEEDE